LVLVDLLRTYSNHVAVLSELISAVDRLQSMDPAESSVVLSVQSERTGPRRRITDRLSETELCNLINTYSAGTPA
jgi:hypothetical protein